MTRKKFPGGEDLKIIPDLEKIRNFLANSFPQQVD